MNASGSLNSLSLQTCAKVCPKFGVLLGPDYAGKSSIFAELLNQSAAYCISYDYNLSDGQSAIVQSVRQAFKPPGMMTGAVYSHEFIISVFHVYMVYLRDRILASARDKPIIVDSYYYKLWAKCVLLGFVNDSIFQLWRSLPRPTYVIYLDVDPELAWRRSDVGRNLNRLEYYGQEPSRHGFEKFQSELRDLMLKEILGVKFTRVQVWSDEDPTVKQIKQMIVESNCL